MRRKESALTFNKTADDAAVGNIVPIVSSEGTDTFKGASKALPERVYHSGNFRCGAGGQLNPHRITHGDWKGNLGTARKYNLLQYQSSCGIADHATRLRRR